MSKELEALNDLREIKGWNDKEFNQRLDIIEKSLKALEIIRKHIKIVNGQFIFKGISYKKNIKDYELLKEVLL